MVTNFSAQFFLLILWIIPIVPLTSFSQSADSVLINRLLKDISDEQVKSDGEFYSGAFPSFRKFGGIPHHYRPDNNIYFTALTVFTLKKLMPYLKGENRKIALQIIENGKKSFPYYKNKNGKPFYNFWPKDTFFPNSYLLKHFRKSIGHGDDADDSVIILMAEESDDSTCNILREKMIATSNLSRKRIKSTFRKYRGIPAYNTYLGKKMPVDFDFGVHCNILYFTFDRHLPLVKQDSATLKLLSMMIERREYMKSPTFLSAYYVKSSILLYHIARLMGRFTISEFEPYRPQLITDIKIELKKVDNIMDKIILNTSLSMLGEQNQMPDMVPEDFNSSNQSEFVFFQARAAYSYVIPLKNIFIHFPYLIYYFYCPAYNKVLWLENLVEKNKKG